MSTSYRPGSWFGIVGEQTTLLLPPNEKERAASLWALIDDGAGFDAVLDALVAGGVSRLAGFVLIGAAGPATRVIVRGDDAALSADTRQGVVLLAGAPGTAWTEQTLDGVTRLSVAVEDSDGEAYAIEGGLVRVAGIETPAAAVSGPAVPEPPAAVEPPPVPLEPPAVEPALPEPEPFLSPDPFEDDTPTGSVPLFEPVAEPAPPAAAPARGRAHLSFSNGEQIDVDQVIVVGRAPEASRILTDEPPRLVPVPSPHHEISSTHLEIRPGSGGDDGYAVVTDLGSTNGTVVVQPGGRPEDLRPGVPVRLQHGALVDLGDGLTIEVS